MITETKGIIKELLKMFLTVILAIILILTVGLTVGAGFAYLNFNRVSESRITGCNSEAAQIGLLFKDFLEENRDDLDFPKDETIIITGKCYNRFNMTAFANEYLKEDTVILDLDSKAGKDKYHWALKLVDGDVSEVWFGKKEIAESDMRPYNMQERYDQIKFIFPLFSPVRFLKYGYIDDSEVLGYCPFYKRTKS